MATQTRPYAIRNSSGDLVGIVEAHNAPSAMRHYARDQFVVEAATFDDGIRAAQAGIAVQRATDPLADA